MPGQKYKYIRKTFTYRGKRYEVTGKTEEEALRKKIEKQLELEQGPQTAGGKILVKNWYDTAFETYKASASDDYRYQMKKIFEKHALPIIGRIPIEDVTPLQCQQVLNSVSCCSQSLITKLSQELFFVFDVARKNKMIKENPAADLIRPKGTTRKRRALTPEERASFLRVLPTDPRFVFFALMLYAGCRPGEAAEVRFDDVVEKDGHLFLHIRGTKTVNSDRLVPLAKELLPYTKTGTKMESFAPNLDGRKHTESSYNRMVAALKRAMNIDMGAKVYRNELIEPLPLAPDFVPYLFRHTYCTDLKKKGIDVRIAKQLMGHSNITTTANIYDHDDDETLLMAARILA